MGEFPEASKHWVETHLKEVAVLVDRTWRIKGDAHGASPIFMSTIIKSSMGCHVIYLIIISILHDRSPLRLADESQLDIFLV